VISLIGNARSFFVALVEDTNDLLEVMVEHDLLVHMRIVDPEDGAPVLWLDSIYFNPYIRSKDDK
jgi:hypothetical protein